MTTHASVRSDEVELLHMYFGTGRPAIEELLAGFEARNSGDGVADVGVDNIRLDVKSRILQRDPPDVWVDWPGENLTPYAEAGVLADLDDVWERADLADAFHEGPVETARVDGTFVAVPLNLQRTNGLFYNCELVERAGVDPAGVADPEGLVDTLATVDESSDAVGMVLPAKNPWPTLQLFETVLLGQHGRAAFEALVEGRAGDHREAIADALRLVDAYAAFATDDAYYLDWTDANGRFLAGESAFFYQGDWAAGAYHDADDFAYGRDWDHVAFPGTDGNYVMVMDAFVVAADAPNLDAARRLVEHVGSREGQTQFNVRRGSIPPRADVPEDRFPLFFREQMRDFEAATQLPSITHGLAVPPNVLIDLKIATSSFVADRDVAAATEAFVDAFDGES